MSPPAVVALGFAPRSSNTYGRRREGVSEHPTYHANVLMPSLSPLPPWFYCSSRVWAGLRLLAPHWERVSPRAVTLPYVNVRLGEDHLDHSHPGA